MVALMVFGWNDVCDSVVQIWPLLFLVADTTASFVFHIMMAQGFELHSQVRTRASCSMKL